MSLSELLRRGRRRMGAALLPVMLIPMVMNGIRGNATNTEMRTVACEPAHISPRLFRHRIWLAEDLKL
jgi:hypothetical protein